MNVRTDVDGLQELLRLPAGVTEVRWLEIEPGSIPATVGQPRLADASVIAFVPLDKAGWERLDQQLGARLEAHQTLLPLDMAEAVLPPWNAAIVRRVHTANGYLATVEGVCFEGRRLAQWPWRSVAVIRLESGIIGLLRHQSTDTQRYLKQLQDEGRRQGA
jgi:hypothetical protein